MSKLVNMLQQIGCVNAKSVGMCLISELRDECWVKMFAQMGYDKGELIFPDGGHSSFFLVLPDGNIATADNVMCANGFYAIAEELGFDADGVLGEEPYGDCVMYEDEDGIEYEEEMITIWTPQEFTQKLQLCKQLATNNMTNEAKDMKKNVIRLTESDLKKIVTEAVKQTVNQNMNYDEVNGALLDEILMELDDEMLEEFIYGLVSIVPEQQLYNFLTDAKWRYLGE